MGCMAALPDDVRALFEGARKARNIAAEPRVALS
jgi:hypothetical protein